MFCKKIPNHKKSATIFNRALPVTYTYAQPTYIVSRHTSTKQTKKPYTFATHTYGNTPNHNFTIATYLQTSKLISNLQGKLFCTQVNNIIHHLNNCICICNYITYTGINKILPRWQENTASTHAVVIIPPLTTKGMPCNTYYTSQHLTTNRLLHQVQSMILHYYKNENIQEIMKLSKKL